MKQLDICNQANKFCELQDIQANFCIQLCRIKVMRNETQLS